MMSDSRTQLCLKHHSRDELCRTMIEIVLGQVTHVQAGSPGVMLVSYSGLPTHNRWLGRETDGQTACSDSSLTRTVHIEISLSCTVGPDQNRLASLTGFRPTMCDTDVPQHTTL